MSPRRSQLSTNIVSLVALQATNYLIPLALIPFLTRTLRIDGFGLFAFIQAFTLYFVLITEYGFNLSASRQIASVKGDPVAVSRIFWSVYVSRALLGVVCFGLMIAIVAAIPRFRADLLGYLASSLVILGSVLVPQWYFQGMECLRSLALLLLVTRASSALVMFGLVRQPDDLVLALAIQGGGSVAGGVLAWILIARLIPVRFYRVTSMDIAESFRSGWYVFLSSAAISLYTNSNVFILGLLTSNTQVGYFSAAEKIARAATGFIGPVSQAIYPRVASLRRSAPDQASRLLRRTLFSLSAVGFGVSVVLIALPEWVIRIVAGDGWEPAASALRLLGLVPLVVAISSVFGTLTMLNFGLERQFAKIVAYAGFLNIGLLVFGSLVWQADGAAAAVLLTEIAVVGGVSVTLAKRGVIQDILGGRPKFRTDGATSWLFRGQSRLRSGKRRL